MAATDLWNNFGFYGARGVPGGEALVYELNRIIREGGIKSPVTSRRGLAARLRYLDGKAGRQALRDAGVSDQRVKTWKAGGKPNTASRQKIENAYWTRRRENVLKSGWLKRLLNNAGAGRLVEIHPVNQSSVVPGRQRDLNSRSITVRYVWDQLVDAYEDRDLEAMDDVWEDIIGDLDSDYAAYAYVDQVLISA